MDYKFLVSETGGLRNEVLSETTYLARHMEQISPVWKNFLVDESERLKPTIGSILFFFGHIIRIDKLEKLILHDKVKGRGKQGRPG